MFSKILVGTDGSETAARAVARAVDLASSVGAQLLVLHAGKGERGQGVLDEVVSQYPDAGIKPILRDGHPADVLGDVAKEERADLLVVGNKGMTGVSRLLGSVPNRVSHNAATHLLIVRTT